MLKPIASLAGNLGICLSIFRHKIYQSLCTFKHRELQVVNTIPIFNLFPHDFLISDVDQSNAGIDVARETTAPTLNFDAALQEAVEEPQLRALKERVEQIQVRELATIANWAERELENYPLTPRFIFNFRCLRGACYTALSGIEIAILVYLDNYPIVKVMGIAGGVILTLGGVAATVAHSPFYKRALIFHQCSLYAEMSRHQFGAQLKAIDQKLEGMQSPHLGLLAV